MLLGIKRIYDKAAITDGKRILVDGLWPRGVKKSTANIDEWVKEVAPSKELRMWFSHNIARWKGFKKRYMSELKGNRKVEYLAEMATTSDITLIYSTKDERHNNAVVLYGLVKASMKAIAKQQNSG
ncbi:MAG: DUF488 family protein [Candidatus Micrarchaeota archaeon]|nr:DUF488 family protein [Candidatus Micrarchaeota archaeon]